MQISQLITNRHLDPSELLAQSFDLVHQNLRVLTDLRIQELRLLAKIKLKLGETVDSLDELFHSGPFLNPVQIDLLFKL